MKEQQDNRKYRMKPGVLLEVVGDPVVYSDANMTDEIAKAILKRNPSLASRFLTIPDEPKKAEKKADDPPSGDPGTSSPKNKGGRPRKTPAGTE